MINNIVMILCIRRTAACWHNENTPELQCYINHHKTLCGVVLLHNFSPPLIIRRTTSRAMPDVTTYLWWWSKGMKSIVVDAEQQIGAMSKRFCRTKSSWEVEQSARITIGETLDTYPDRSAHKVDGELRGDNSTTEIQILRGSYSNKFPI